MEIVNQFTDTTDLIWNMNMIFAWFITFDPDCTENRNILKHLLEYFIVNKACFNFPSLPDCWTIKEYVWIASVECIFLFMANEASITLQNPWPRGKRFQHAYMTFVRNFYNAKIKVTNSTEIRKHQLISVDTLYAPRSLRALFLSSQAETGREKFHHNTHIHWTWCEQMILVTFEIEFLLFKNAYKNEHKH